MVLLTSLRVYIIVVCSDELWGGGGGGGPGDNRYLGIPGPTELNRKEESG